MNARREGWFARYGLGLALIAAVAALTAFVVKRWHTPGKLDVIAAQAMDMSEMRPPAGAAPVKLAAVRRGSLADTIVYTGTVQAYNTQDVSPRITGQVTALPVYPGQSVRAGQVVAQLDTAEIGAKAAQAAAEARGAVLNEKVAELTHYEHHRAALAQADAQASAAAASVADARAQAAAADDGVTDAKAAVASAQASVDYWKVEIAREKRLADAGAASRQEYEQELSQARAADAALSSADSKLRQSRAMADAARARLTAAQKGADAAKAAREMATVDLDVAQAQHEQAAASAQAAKAAERQADVVAGYARIAAPASGVVTERPVSPGTLVQPGTVLLRIAEIDRVRVQANVAVTDLEGIAPGSPVEIVPQAAGAAAAKPLTAKVSSVFPAADAASRTAVVEAVVPNPRHALLPGAFVTMRLQKRRVRDALLVPADALVYSGGKAAVWAASADGGSVRQVAVTAGASDGTVTEVAGAGLSEGDRVVTKGQAGLRDGVAVVEVTDWGPDGPAELPKAAAATKGAVRYRCAVCNMTYSAEDAAKYHYVDPMDGGKLVPVTDGGNGGAK